MWVYVVLVGPGHSVSLWLYGLPSLSSVMMQTKHLVSTEIGQTTQNQMWSLIGDWSGAFDLRRPTVAKV